jgi:hypothetical protein
VTGAVVGPARLGGAGSFTRVSAYEWHNAMARDNVIGAASADRGAPLARPPAVPAADVGDDAATLASGT